MTRGFIALISVLLVCGSLLVIVATLSLRSFYVRQSVLEREFKEQGRAYARSCIESLQLRLYAEPAYEGGDDMRIGDGICVVSRRIAGAVIIGYEYRGTNTLYRVDIDSETRAIETTLEIPSP